MGDVNVEIKNVRARKQLKKFTCGPASLRSIFYYYGVNVSEQELVEMGDITDEGAGFTQLRRLAREYGFSFYSRYNASLDEVRRWLLRGVPVLICYQDWGPPSGRNGHYAVLIGVGDGYVKIADPANHFDGDGQKFAYEKKMEIKNFLHRWFDYDSGVKMKHWFAIIKPRE